VRLNATPATGWLRRGEGPGGWWRELRPGEDAGSQTRLIVGYHELTRPDRPGGAITLAFCLAHARRKFFDVFKANGSAVAEEALRQFQAIYEIEARIRGLTAAERVSIRQTQTKPILEAFKAWLLQRLEEESAKSRTAEAIRYTLNHWEGSMVFLTDGRVEVDTNVVEREIRPIVLGRCNALFSGSARGAEAWAILASLINTCKLHDLDPQTYLTDVLEKIVSGQIKVNALHELLPWKWKEAQAVRQAA
jgi:transposase